MSEHTALPQSIPAADVLAAVKRLGLDPMSVKAVHIEDHEVEVIHFVPDADGDRYPGYVIGAETTTTIPIKN